MNAKDQKEIKAFDDWLDFIKGESEKYRKKGILYGRADFTDMDLAADEVERRMADGEQIEDFVPKMINEGYVMEVFE